MKLLIVTQSVDLDNPVLGFFHGWILEFAKRFETVTVICLEKGRHDLPHNVHVLSLGKEEKVSRLQYIKRFYKYIWQERNNYDAVFVHMNPVYVVLGGVLWRLLGKKIGLWYVHRQVTLLQRIAARFSHTIFTSSKESFRINTPKRIFVGHAIDTHKFFFKQKSHTTPPVVVTVGRITEIKNLDILLTAVNLFHKNGKNIKVFIIGEPVTPTDHEVLARLKKYVNTNSLETDVTFVGSVPHNKIIDFYHGATLSVNLCPTGGMDKVVLESMSTGTPCLFSNKAFIPFLKDYSKFLYFEEGNANDLYDKLEKFFDQDYGGLSTYCRTVAETNFSFDVLFNRIFDTFKNN